MDIFDYNIKAFWSKVNKVEDDKCWLWMGTLRSKQSPYGKFWSHNKQFLAHRVSWEIHNGPIQEGLFVCHHCDNPRCVNPGHLFVGTAKDNTRDMLAKDRNPANKFLSEEDVLVIRALFHWSKFKMKDLADEFAVTSANICMIVNNQTWKKVRTDFASL